MKVSLMSQFLIPANTMQLITNHFKNLCLGDRKFMGSKTAASSSSWPTIFCPLIPPSLMN